MYCNRCCKEIDGDKGAQLISPPYRNGKVTFDLCEPCFKHVLRWNRPEFYKELPT